MNITIDHREPKMFRTMFSDEDSVSVETLRVGDFQINKTWVFERKTLADLCASLVDGRLFKQAGYRPKGKKARQLYVLQGLPTIGTKRANALLDHFGGIEAVMTAAEDELAEVDGIGYPIAEKIRNLVRETGVPYGHSDYPITNIE